MALFICQGCGAEHTSWEGKCPKCGTSETIRLAPNTDRMIDRVVKGKFKILKKLGQGGMGAVYLAEQVGIGHRVALKFLKSEFSTDPEIARRFLNEAKSYARVAHPNAVALHDFGQDDEGNLFIAMEYCEGVDLKKVIAEQGALPMVEAIEVVLQVADVLANAHDKGVVHRDLKPENIMIRRGMRGVHAKVLDFGIARLMDAGTKLTVAGAIAGTPRYMSPEQVEGREADHRADIYSLGIVLFETLTGRQPFDGQTIAEILRRQAIEPMPHLNEVAAELDYPELDSVIQKACAKKRDERWPDMLTFANALSQATPTAAHLGLSPLQKSGVSHKSMATPRPGVPNTTPASTSGVAIPGAAVDQSSTEQTVVKLGDSSNGLKAPVLPGSGTASTNSTQMEGQLRQASLGDLSAERATDVAARAADLSMSRPPEPVAPSSKTPIIAALVAVVVVLGGGVAWFATQKAPEPVKPPEPVAKVDPVKLPEPVKPPEPVKDPVPTQPAQEVTEAFVAGQFALGQSAFEVGNLDNAETFLSKVPDTSPLKPKADDLRAKIKTINETMAQADRNRANGHCELALPQYARVLGLNARFAPANEGAGRCRAANVSNQME